MKNHGNKQNSGRASRKAEKGAEAAKRPGKGESRALTKLALILPDAATGRRRAMEQRFHAAYASGDPGPIIRKAKNATLARYLLVLAIALISIIAIMRDGSGAVPLDSLRRDSPGGSVKTVEAEAEAEYNGVTLRIPAVLRILPEEPDPDAVGAMLEDLKERLPGIVLGNNSSSAYINQDLRLPKHDGKTGIDISWQSDNEGLIGTDGKVNMVDGKPGDKVTITADLRCGPAADSLEMPLTLGSPEKAYDFSRDMKMSVDGLVNSLNAGTGGDAVSLPGKTGSGLRLSWKKPQDMTVYALPVICAALFLWIFKRRYAFIDGDIKKFRESIRREFPDFLGKLILLLNAGMVATAAVEKIAEDYRWHRRSGEEKGFYEELCGIENRMHGSNTMLTVEFSDMASRSGQREIMRFSAILSDNIDKGSALAEKLMRENDMLWNLRKKRAEERGRVAETKLTFPMALQLLAVMLITVAPAAFEMG